MFSLISRLGRLGALGLLLLVRPAAAQQPPAQTPVAGSQYRVAEVSITDKRTSPTGPPLQPPTISRTGQLLQAWPALTEAQQARIRTLLVSHFQGAPAAAAAATLHCRVLEAYQLFSSQITERVEVFARVQLELRSAQGELLAAATGEQALSRRSLDATAKGALRLYDQALDGALRQGLQQLNGAPK